MANQQQQATPYYLDAGAGSKSPQAAATPAPEYPQNPYRDERPLEQEIEAQEQQNQADYARDAQAERDVAAQMVEYFKDQDREQFYRFIKRPGHVNAMRIEEAKQARILHYLRNPNAPASRGQQAKDKFEAKKKWLLLHNAPHLIYRQPCEKFPQPRLLVPEQNAFDAIAYEHIRLGHYGRNRMQKLVTDRYYGVSRQEIQWVIDRCSKCAPKKHRGPAVQSEVVDDRPDNVEQALEGLQQQQQQQQQQHQQPPE